jgi:hypothetical protein
MTEESTKNQINYVNYLWQSEHGDLVPQRGIVVDEGDPGVVGPDVDQPDQRRFGSQALVDVVAAARREVGVREEARPVVRVGDVGGRDHLGTRQALHLPLGGGAHVLVLHSVQVPLTRLALRHRNEVPKGGKHRR